MKMDNFYNPKGKGNLNRPSFCIPHQSRHFHENGRYVNWYKIDIGRFLKPKRSVNLEFMAVTYYQTICCQVISTFIKLY